MREQVLAMIIPPHEPQHDGLFVDMAVRKAWADVSQAASAEGSRQEVRHMSATPVETRSGTVAE